MVLGSDTGNFSCIIIAPVQYLEYYAYYERIFDDYESRFDVVKSSPIASPFSCFSHNFPSLALIVTRAVTELCFSCQEGIQEGMQEAFVKETSALPRVTRKKR